MFNNKLISLFFMIFSLVNVESAFAKDETANTMFSVGDVFKTLVLPDKACVWRSVEIQPSSLKKGINYIQVTGVPVEADINSFKVSIGKNLRSSVSIEEVDVFVYKGSKIQELQKSINALESNKQDLHVEQNICDFKISFLKKTSSNITSLNNINQYVDSLEKLLREQLVLQKSLNINLEELEKELVSQKKSLALIQEKGEEIRLNIKLLVEEIPENNDRIIVSYWDKRAGYYISYNIRILPESDQVEIVSFVNIWQDTGYEWKDVLLSVSLGNDALESKEFIDKKDTVPVGNKGNSYFFDNNIYKAVLKYENDIKYPGKMILKAEIINNNDYDFTKGGAKVFYGGNYIGQIDFGPCAEGMSYVISFVYQYIDAVSKKLENIEQKEW